MDGLVTPLDLVPFQVDEHVGQAGDGSHEQRRQAANDPQARQRPTGQPTRNEKTEDDRQEQRPRSPREQTLPEQKAALGYPLLRSMPKPRKHPADQPDLVQDSAGQHRSCQRPQQQIRRMNMFQSGEPGGVSHGWPGYIASLHFGVESLIRFGLSTFLEVSLYHPEPFVDGARETESGCWPYDYRQTRLTDRWLVGRSCGMTPRYRPMR